MPLTRLARAKAALGVTAVVVTLLAAAKGAAAPPSASKQVKAECVAASERAIALRSKGELRAAREQLVVCGRDECPAIVKEECASGLRAIDERIPTVVFGVHDADDKDVTDVRLAIDDDGEPHAIDGRVRSFDPGPHRVRVLQGDKVLKEETVVLRESERNRVVTLRLEGPKKTAEPPVPVTTRSPIPKVVPFALAGVGVAALVTSGLLSLHLDGRVNSARASCAPDCDAAERDSLSTQLKATNAFLIGGIVALAAAGVTYFLARDRAATTARAFGAFASPL